MEGSKLMVKSVPLEKKPAFFPKYLVKCLTCRK